MISPFPSWLVRAEHAERVVSPPYDGVSPERRRELIDTNPDTFLHVTRSPEDAPSGAGDLDALAAHSLATLHGLLERDRFVEHREPSLYVYELTEGDHRQTAIVGELPVVEYDSGAIRVHERTRTARAEVLAHNLEHVRVTSSPVAIAYRRHLGVADLVKAVARTEPELDFVVGEALGQRVWRVTDRSWITATARALAERAFYIVDGHHRTAAASIVHARHPDDPGFATFLGAFFAADELLVRPFHRLVDNSADRVDEVLAGLADDYVVSPSDEPVVAARKGEFGLVADGRWWRLTPRRPDPGAIDVELLQRRVLAPLLGIDDPASSSAVHYVPGVGGVEPLVHRTSETNGIGFTVLPVNLDQLMTEADAGRTLPPKSTYFHPKARSGVFLRFR